MHQLDEQRAIINAPAHFRIFVEAQPGTGKTAVACARVVRLIRDEDLNPSSILMISFTRTAVAEMKTRIRQWIQDGQATAINIATLDQTAFSFGIGCGQEFEELMGSFDDNIENAIKQLEDENPTLIEYISGLNHVIIDEAQDITGSRIRLVSLLLTHLRKDAGVTIFADRAQSIYGFTTDIDEKTEAEKSFVDHFDFQNNGYQCLELTKIHRTDDPALLALFRDTRKAVMERKEGWNKPLSVIEQIRKSGPFRGNETEKLFLQDGDLVLFRKRVAALIASQFCPDLFRLRLPGYPSAVFPWIGLCFWDWKKPLITRGEFESLWKKVPVPLHDGFYVDKAWNLLTHFAADRRNNIDLSRLRAIIARPRPPVELCYLDYGARGPIFSTIHASKGREADRVFLMLPRDGDLAASNKGLDAEEEARVYYVGATRVRKEFFHGIAATMFGAGRLDEKGNRIVEVRSINKLPKFQFGLAGDLNETDLISREYELCSSEEQAVTNHQNLIDLWQSAVQNGDVPNVTGHLKQIEIRRVEQYLYSFNASRKIIAWSGPGLKQDLWATANKLQKKTKYGKLRPPDEINHLRLIGLRTCAIPPNPAVEGSVHEPFSTSGFFIAPMIVGFPSVFFIFQKKRR